MTWSSALFAVSGVLRGGSVLTLYEHAWAMIQRHVKPMLPLLVFTAFHIVEYLCRVPVINLSPSWLTRIQPWLFIAAYAALFVLYLVPYLMPSPPDTGAHESASSHHALPHVQLTT